MNDASLLIQRPSGSATALVLLFHGVGATADDLAPLGQHAARALPQAMVVSVGAPHACDLGRGYQWFSVAGVTEHNRMERVHQAMPSFQQTVAHWQREAGVDAAHTTLIGFSQGAIMALESTQGPTALAHRVIAIAGRFVQAPHQAPRATAIHLLHGEQDGVIAATQSRDAAMRLNALGATVTADFYPGLGHGVDARVVERVVTLLTQTGASAAPA